LSAPSTASVIHSRWEIAARLVADSRDLLDARPGAGGGEPSAALTTRGWAAFLLSLEPHELEAIETRGPDADWPDRTPAALRQLVERARLACSVPVLHDASTSAPTPSPRPGETPRKRAQIDAFARLVAPLAALSSRVLDVGSGHGHLTRDLAGRLGLPVVGLERDPVLANRACALSPDGRSVFTVTDVLRDGLALSPGDCVVGLHACGELGEVMVRSVAQTRAAAVVLVSCCLQKRRQLSRAPLGVPAGVEPAALELPRSLLGLSNLASPSTACCPKPANRCAWGRRSRVSTGAPPTASFPRSSRAPSPSAIGPRPRRPRSPRPTPGRRWNMPAPAASRCRARSFLGCSRSVSCSTARLSWSATACMSRWASCSRPP
jgi:hypothetical protein